MSSNASVALTPDLVLQIATEGTTAQVQLARQDAIDLAAALFSFAATTPPPASVVSTLPANP